MKREYEGRLRRCVRHTERDKEKKEMREGAEKLLLVQSDVLLTIHYPQVMIYTFYTHSGMAALTFLTRTVCVTVLVCVVCTISRIQTCD